jgi:lipoprotein-anchoring transpeptidase ErfK/SrfK
MFRSLRTFLVAIVALASAGAVSAAPLRLEVDLSDRVLRAFVGSEQVARYDVAVGTKNDPTPRGTFTIRKIVWNPSWHPPEEKWAKGKTSKPPGHPDNPMKRVKMFFQEPDYYIHGTGDEDSLGSAASHGCVRMSPHDVTELAKLVMARGGKPQPEPWYRRILHSRATKVIFLKQPVAIQIRG